ncbi:uncharacterized protein GJ701_006286 [Geothlypis trichas]
MARSHSARLPEGSDAPGGGRGHRRLFPGDGASKQACLPEGKSPAPSRAAGPGPGGARPGPGAVSAVRTALTDGRTEPSALQKSRGSESGGRAGRRGGRGRGEQRWSRVPSTALPPARGCAGKDAGRCPRALPARSLRSAAPDPAGTHRVSRTARTPPRQLLRYQEHAPPRSGGLQRRARRDPGAERPRRGQLGGTRWDGAGTWGSAPAPLRAEAGPGFFRVSGGRRIQFVGSDAVGGDERQS